MGRPPLTRQFRHEPQSLRLLAAKQHAGDLRLLPRGEALADVPGRSDQRRLVHQLVRHQRDGLGLLACEIQVLDLCGLLAS